MEEIKIREHTNVMKGDPDPRVGAQNLVLCVEVQLRREMVVGAKLPLEILKLIEVVSHVDK